MPTLKSNLKSARLTAGLSQTALARQAAISRQAYVSIETGRSVPSTEVSLRLARALGCTVESLFSLPFEEGSTVRAELVPTPHPSPTPSRVQLFSVGGRLLARPLFGRSSTSYTMTPADGIAMTSDSPGDVSVRLLAPLDQANTLVLAGGDPAIPFLSRDLALRDFRMIRLGEDSNTALAYLSAGNCPCRRLPPLRRGHGPVQRVLGPTPRTLPLLCHHLRRSGAGPYRGTPATPRTSPPSTTSPAPTSPSSTERRGPAAERSWTGSFPGPPSPPTP